MCDLKRLYKFKLNLAGNFAEDNHKSNTAMSDFAPSLPQDLVTDILLRLPAKSIGQFRCVSKPWRSLLSNPQFIKTHLTLQIHDPQKLILIGSSDRSLYTLTFTTDGSTDAVSRKLICSPLQDNTWANVVGSCHGLVLILDEESSKFLINPTTMDIAKVPNFSLALDPFGSFSMYGLGYDSCNDDYKIVALSYYDTDNEHEPDCAETFVDIYSAKMETWRRLNSSPYDHAVPHVASGVFVNGCIHWLACDVSTEGQPSVIAAFNLGSEEFEKVPPPSSLDVSKFVFNELVVLGGCLAMVVDLYNGQIDVWVMKEYGVQESWTKFSINMPEDTDSFNPICLLRDEEIVVEKDAEKLVVYNLREGIWRDMVVPGIPDLFDVGFEDRVMTFTESLLSPNFKSN